jgi:phosphate transport system ATP-binding protein
MISPAHPPILVAGQQATNGNGPTKSKVALDVKGLNVFYGSFHAVRDVSLEVETNKITALIGPSGCGKSTVLRSFNRMNDLVPIARVEGEVLFHGHNIYDKHVDPVEVRRRIGMVFQKPNPFPAALVHRPHHRPEARRGAHG